MKFHKKFLKEIAFGGDPSLENDIIDHTRWSVVYRQVFKFDGKFYETTYSVGATEQQDESPYEYDDDEIECKEVFPIQETRTIYK